MYYIIYIKKKDHSEKATQCRAYLLSIWDVIFHIIHLVGVIYSGPEQIRAVRFVMVKTNGLRIGHSQVMGYMLFHPSSQFLLKKNCHYS